jgi:hypothetical protein
MGPTKCQILVTVVITVMVVIVPIPLRVPATFVLVPPPVLGIPAALTLLAQFLAGMRGLAAAETMAGNRLIHFAVGSGDAVLAITLIGTHQRRPGKHQKSCERRSSESITA